jgi:hypothetical protein
VKLPICSVRARRLQRFLSPSLVADPFAGLTARFLLDLAGRMIHTLMFRPQISTDGFAAYPEAFDSAFANESRYGMVIEDFNENNEQPVSSARDGSSGPSPLLGNRRSFLDLLKPCRAKQSFDPHVHETIHGGCPLASRRHWRILQRPSLCSWRFTTSDGTHDYFE